MRIAGLMHFAIAVVVWCTAGAASAHVRLLFPEPRAPDDGIKDGPCGRYPPGTGPRTELVAGSEITLRFEETVEHPGYFRVAFSPDGDAGYEEHVLVEQIPVRRDDPRPHQYAVAVRLPDTPCERCSLQVVQYMLENPARPRLYFSCADVRLTAPARDAGPASSDAAAPDALAVDGGAPDSSPGPDSTIDAVLAMPLLDAASPQEDASAEERDATQPARPSDVAPHLDGGAAVESNGGAGGGCAAARPRPIPWLALVLFWAGFAANRRCRWLNQPDSAAH